MEWHPSATLQERKILRSGLLRHSGAVSHSPVSEFLSEENILRFFGEESKIEVVEALVGSLHGRDHEAALQAIWAREREGALRIAPDIGILRGRLEDVHHIRAAIGLCSSGIVDPSNPDGKTRIFVLFVGPVNQTRLHAGLLVRISALFHNRRLVEKLLRAKTGKQTLEILRQAESPGSQTSFFKRGFRKVAEFFKNRYALGVPDGGT